MFLVLVKSEYAGDTSAWAVDDTSFDTLVDAVSWAKDRAKEVPNVFAVVEVDRMFQRSIIVTEVEVAS